MCVCAKSGAILVANCNARWFPQVVQRQKQKQQHQQQQRHEPLLACRQSSEASSSQLDGAPVFPSAGLCGSYDGQLCTPAARPQCSMAKLVLQPAAGGGGGGPTVRSCNSVRPAGRRIFRMLSGAPDHIPPN